MVVLNDIAQGVWTELISEHPEWEPYFGVRGENDLEAAFPAQPESQAGHLVVFTENGKDIWVRFSPPAMCYSVENTVEMLAIISDLLTERVAFATTWRGDNWTGTTLIAKDKEPIVEPGEVAVVVSWTGAHDRIVPKDAMKPHWWK